MGNGNNWRLMSKERTLKNEALQKELNDLEYWINYMAECITQKLNGSDAEFDWHNAPQQLHKLHQSVTCIMQRMYLNALNETRCDDINDDALLEELFGKPIVDKKQVVVDNKSKQKEQHKLEET